MAPGILAPFRFPRHLRMVVSSWFSGRASFPSLIHGTCEDLPEGVLSRSKITLLLVLLSATNAETSACIQRGWVSFPGFWTFLCGGYNGARDRERSETR
jgi:hypothetical protein